jgi:hypothetical protein
MGQGACDKVFAVWIVSRLGYSNSIARRRANLSPDLMHPMAETDISASVSAFKDAPMPDARTTLALAATLLLSVPAMAQDTGTPLRDLDAKRINPYQILIDFELDGGACDSIGRPEIGDLVDGTLSVTFPTSTTAEVCTMQIKELDYEYAIEAENIISRIDVTLTSPEGRIISTGSTQVDQD